MVTYFAGIDVGSTTVKLVILDENKKILFGEYRRHCAHTQETLCQLLREGKEALGECNLKLKITGSGSINLGKALEIGFVQEVAAVATALKFVAPQTDVAIELGGEDAKIIYFDGNNVEERMNGICAGGTGSFIDQMAAILQTDATGLNEEAVNYKQIYPIAARCGVFAKTDIQPLINEGATKADLAASIFQSVVNQTVSGLACGKPIRGCVAFLGGPLHFLPELKKAFIRTLKLTPETTVDPENSHLFAAMGAALEADDAKGVEISALIDKLNSGIEMKFELKRLDSLFENQEELDEFERRHQKACVKKGDIATYQGDCYLGIDAGSTTTKLALIGRDGELLYSFYANNQGSPIKTAMRAMEEVSKHLPSSARIAYSCSTGYGENLLKSAFNLDVGEVETIAHCTAASFFDPQVDCVLDIGGQDMKCVKIKNGSVDNILLNEACSSGCGSFIENFANSLGFTAAEFAKEALFAKNPIDLGTRCTVFMNSNVKQAQKEGATVSDISAGLAYSVIKNALFKVIKLNSAADLGAHVVVQGGTFYNRAVLRAFERVSGVLATCPDISGIMGAFGAALIARDRHKGQLTSTLPIEEILKLTYDTKTIRCQGCNNKCLLTVNTFPGGRKHITGNRCEKGLGNEKGAQKGENLVEYKMQRLFDYEPLSVQNAPRGEIGLPRVLNMYENYPFWATFFKELGFRVILSPKSTRKLYELGMDTIPSESECYPAKLSHGHIKWLINEGVKTIFYPCVFYEKQEKESAQNHFNCPIVVSYSENLKNNVEEIVEGQVKYLRPFIAFTDEKTAYQRLLSFFTREKGYDIGADEIKNAVSKAWAEQTRAKDDIRKKGKEILDKMAADPQKRGIVLAGRPYHIDPEINHGIPELIASYGFNVFTEDSLPEVYEEIESLRVNDQWVYHSRLYNAATFVRKQENLELIQLNSFGCGLDAVTTDQVSEILEGSNRLYTVLKIDEVNNLGAVRIRIRSLISAMNMRREKGIVPSIKPVKYERTEFTKQMFQDKYTILAPQMSPIHFDILEPVFEKYGYNLEVLSNDNRGAIDVGLRYVNNDACFPSITVVGQVMDAVMSGKYNTDKLAIIMTQTGGCCRASNYVGFIRRALDKVGMSHIPVISLNASGMEKNEGFKLKLKMVIRALKGVILGDLIMRCLYRTRPYELEAGSANELHKKWRDIAIDLLVNDETKYKYKKVCRGIVEDFDNLPLDEGVKKPRVGVVGEILVKYMPLANNHLVNLLESEGAEAVVPDLIDFLNYCLYNSVYKHRYLGIKWGSKFKSLLGIKAIEFIRKPAKKALLESKRFDAPIKISEVADLAKPFLSIGNQYGEGWFLTGEMVELIKTDAPNIVCIQPFACLPNHVVGKGVIKLLRKNYPESNIVAVDYDPGASEVNQLNRIKLMLNSAKKNLDAKEENTLGTLGNIENLAQDKAEDKELQTV
ncbi:MAG: 2-hydroxyacyl-CoA dehydratase [Clostridia bacterium]|nr:2-hydroxyacyl-CoA dehydratase [Clostridia bacterium]